jgi:putative tryptophan/tyrosine transport system substrate-binding protein
MCALLVVMACWAAGCGAVAEAPDSGSSGGGSALKLGIVYFAPDPGADSCTQGLLDRLAETGFVEGRNLEVLKSHAQGEIANTPALLQNYDNSDVDVIVTFTTPCLTAACNTVKNKPVVFTYVYDPIAAGAATSRTDHLPNITGVGSFPPITKTIHLIADLVPGVKSVGTLYNSSEANSRKVVSVARDVFRERGITLEEVPVTNSSEVFPAAQALASRRVEAIWVSGDNTALLAFEGIVRVAGDAGIPLIINDPEFVERGALAAAGIGWYQSGYAAGKLAADVLLGDAPGNMPIEEVAVETLSVNFEAARKLGARFPAGVLEKADVYLNLSALHQRPVRIALASSADTTLSGDWTTQFTEALAGAGLVIGADFELAEVKPGKATGSAPSDVWVAADGAAGQTIKNANQSAAVVTASDGGKVGDPKAVALQAIRRLAGAGK